MDEAAATRQAALDAIDDVEPDELHGRLAAVIRETSMVPGALTIFSARACLEGASLAGAADTPPDVDQLTRRAAGVQLIYNGLDHTRYLARREPWGGADEQESTAAADLGILVADVLVARGFHLLAHTPAAEQAVHTVQAFGRDQTLLRQRDEPDVDVNLEANVLELAVVAGSSLGDGATAAGLRDVAADLSAGLDESGEFPSTPSFFPENLEDQLGHVFSDAFGSGRATGSVDD